MSPVLRYTPWAVLGTATLFLLAMARPPSDPTGALQYHEFGKVPVVQGGRVKPIDTLARNSLLVISGRQTFYDEDDKERPAEKWLLDVMTCDRGYRLRRVFRIEDAELQKDLHLPSGADNLFSLEDLGPTVHRLLELDEGADQIDPKLLRDPRAQTLLGLARRVHDYIAFGRYVTPYKVFRIDNDQVLALLGLQPRSGLRYAYTEFAEKIPDLIEKAEVAEKKKDRERDTYDNKLLEVYRRVQLYIGLARREGDTLRLVPPSGDETEWQTWAAVDAKARKLALERVQEKIKKGELNPQKLNNAQAEAEVARARAEVSPPAQVLADIFKSYEDQDTTAFNSAVSGYRQQMNGQLGGKARLCTVEMFFNHFEPFYQCSLLYVMVFLLVCCSWIGWTGPLGRSAFWLTVLVFAVHTAALGARMYIMGRPPVTNLYSSAVFIGWGAIIVGLVLELIFRNGLGTAVAAAVGAMSLIVAQHLATSGETMEMLQAVLDTNFWLATHVTCVTFGYMATFVAGFLGIAYVILRVITGFQRKTDRLNQDTLRTVAQMNYAIICFATLFSFTGTVLGGIWADQSWGRFWGWDPKENGALLIVLWNVLILHARWGGIAKQAGTAMLSVGGNMVTGWSWFGTNQLGVGLHSYGFNNALAFMLVGFWAVNLLVIGLGLVPVGFWQLFAQKPVDHPPPRPRKPVAALR